MVQAKQEIAYLFELKGSVSCTSASKNVGQPWGFVERIYGGSMIDKLYNSLKDTSVHSVLFRTVCLKSISLVMHGNVIRKLQNHSLITK